MRALRGRGFSPANGRVLTASRAVVSAMENRPRGTYREHGAAAAWGRRAGPSLCLRANAAAPFPLANWVVVAPVL